MVRSAEFVEIAAAEGCDGCEYCTAQLGARDVAAGTGQLPHIRESARRKRAAGVVLALATGMVGLGTADAPSAEAMPAPSKAGWDGTRYWFKSNSQWRWTSHYHIYLQRTRQAPAQHTGQARAQRTWLAAPQREGWDGTRYWFRSNGQWRWTSHYGIYVQRRHTDGSPSTSSERTPAPTRTSRSSGVERAVDYALAQLGKPYIWGGNGPVGYDCSGLVQQAYQRAGISLPRVASDQYGAVTKISQSSLRRGDLLFWSSNGRQSGVHHVAVYLGDGRYVEAPRPGKNIRTSALYRGFYPTFFGRP
ncbi:C40 family peptidase [Streptomyces sp. bgisy130]|uniref:C40 family peptidase n=1 Tax=Streptomyces sp. bgisy130 TaxID=3413788 RepID=UPI003F4A23E5